jgi:hypothetical protein
MGAFGLIVVFVLRRLGVIRVANRPGDAPAAG